MSKQKQSSRNDLGRRNPSQPPSPQSTAGCYWWRLRRRSIRRPFLWGASPRGRRVLFLQETGVVAGETGIMVNDLQKLIDALRRDFAAPPPPSDEEWQSAALNVIDCVFSLNRNYENFVLPRVVKFREKWPEVQSLRQLRDLIDASPSPLDFSEAHLNYKDAARARILSEVVDYLLDVQDDFVGATEVERLRRCKNRCLTPDLRSQRNDASVAVQHVLGRRGSDMRRQRVHGVAFAVCGADGDRMIA